MTPAIFSMEINIRRYWMTLAVTALVFVSIHCFLKYYHYTLEEIPWLILQLFDLDEENNLPTWFSSFLLLNSAIVLTIPARRSSGRDRFWWTFLSAGFLVLSIDEVAGLHESLNTAIEINWAIPGGILVLVTGVLFIPFLRSLPRRVAILFLASGCIYVSGAIAIELLSEDMDEDSLAYGFAVALEESLEMAGALMFLAVNLHEVKKGGPVKVSFT